MNNKTGRKRQSPPAFMEGIFLVICMFFVMQSGLGQCQDNITKQSNPAAGSALLKLLNSTRPFEIKAMQSMKRGDFRESVINCRKGLALFNHVANLWLMMAQSFEKLGMEKDALEAYHELVYPQGWGSSIGSDPTTQMQYVLALLRSKKWEEAVGVYELTHKSPIYIGHIALVDSPFHFRVRETARLEGLAHLVLGSRRPEHEMGDPVERKAHLTEAVKRLPNNAMAQYAYAAGCSKRGHFAESKKAYLKAMSLGTPTMTKYIKPRLRDVQYALHEKVVVQ